MTADNDLTLLYTSHYAPLVRLAVLLLGDVGEAEEIAQEAFIRVLGKPRELREPDRAFWYLRRTVVNLANSRLRRRLLAVRRTTLFDGRRDAYADIAMDVVNRNAIVRALHRLPSRQRQAVVLRHYAQFTETEAADLMGISVGAVRAYASRGVARLRDELKESR